LSDWAPAGDRGREQQRWKLAQALFELSCLEPAAYRAVMDAWSGQPDELCAALAAASDVIPVTVPRAEPEDVSAWMAAPQPLYPDGRLEANGIHSFGEDVRPKRMNGLPFRTAREIAEMTSDDVPFAAPFLVFGAITELDGKPKTAGKTTFVLATARSILDGLPFLGQATLKGPIVMLTEQPPSSLKAALVRAGLASRDDFVLLSWADAAGTPWPEIVAGAEAKCDEIGARVLIVDTLPQFAGLRGDPENNSGHALEAIEPLQLLAAKGLAILVTRHDRKVVVKSARVPVGPAPLPARWTSPATGPQRGGHPRPRQGRRRRARPARRDAVQATRHPAPRRAGSSVRLSAGEPPSQTEQPTAEHSPGVRVREVGASRRSSRSSRRLRRFASSN
jgi:hypothetical protein